MLAESGKVAVDVLLVSATTVTLDDPLTRRDLPFSDPLYTRLAVEDAGVPLFLPGLRDRIDDMPVLFEHFLERATREVGGRWPKAVDPEVLERLAAYPWPANLADLRGVAAAAARSARDFEEVLPRHVVIPGQSAAVIVPAVHPGRPADPRAGPPAGVARQLRDWNPAPVRGQLKGAVRDLTDGFGVAFCALWPRRSR